MKSRRNYFVDLERVRQLEKIAESENATVSELVREGIERVIADRLNRPYDTDQNAIARGYAKFFERYIGSQPDPGEDIEALISEETGSLQRA